MLYFRVRNCPKARQHNRCPIALFYLIGNQRLSVCLRLVVLVKPLAESLWPASEGPTTFKLILKVLAEQALPRKTQSGVVLDHIPLVSLCWPTTVGCLTASTLPPTTQLMGNTIITYISLQKQTTWTQLIVRYEGRAPHQGLYIAQ